MENKFKIVDFKNYCPKCKYYIRPEKCDPCNECLEVGANENTSEPVRFEAKKKGDKNSAGRKRNWKNR